MRALPRKRVMHNKHGSRCHNSTSAIRNYPLHDRSISVGQLDSKDADLQAWLDAQRSLNLLELLGPRQQKMAPRDHPGGRNINSVTLRCMPKIAARNRPRNHP